MKYRLTPLNFFCALLIGFVLLYYMIPGSLSWEFAVFLVPVIPIGILIDYFLQKVLKKYAWLFIAEIVLIVMSIWVNDMH